MSQEASYSTAQVMVVDDEPDVLDLLRDGLASFGYQVSTATNGEEALELARERKFDLALCGTRLRGINGMQLTATLSRMHPQMPVIHITAEGDVEAGRQALEAGASDFVAKPLETTSLPFILEDNLQRKRLEARRLSEERADVLFKALKVIAAAIDAKSHYASSHSARMADLSVAIGTELDLSQDRLNTLELAAHIHDVGKIGTPDSVLDKPGKLSDDEWVDIVKHPAVGSDFLAGTDELSEVASAIRHHHEHLDGSGYPDGLKADAIPFLARILAVADAFEAMTSDRPYRPAISQEEALGELCKHAGTQFDRAVVETAVRVAKSASAGDSEKRAA